MPEKIPGDEKLVPIFSVDTKENKALSKKEGRPIFEEREIITLRIPGDQQRVIVQPAHHVSHWDSGTAITYAMRFSDQYRRFKESRTQIQAGTPISELPFLTEAKRSELRALSVHTAEILAGLEGPNLQRLGLGGRELKNQAKAFLEAASGTASITAMAATIADLKAQIEALSATKIADTRAAIVSEAEAVAEPPIGASMFETFSDEDLKLFIANETGSRPRGNPSHATLVSMCDEIQQKKAA